MINIKTQIKKQEKNHLTRKKYYDIITNAGKSKKGTYIGIIGNEHYCKIMTNEQHKFFIVLSFCGLILMK